MIQRKEYMNGTFTHREYFSQFVDEEVKSEVLRKFGKERLLKSKDEHLNDLPLKEWDDLSGFTFHMGEVVSRPHSIRKELHDKLKETGEGVSPAGLVCIYKEGARQVIESLQA
jgi:hypothetical protein